MDFLCVAALFAALSKDESCQRPYKLWFLLTGFWAFVSFVFLWWWQRKELGRQFHTKRSIAFSYLLEGGYLALTVFAWVMLAQDDATKECQENAPQLTELMVDMIILLYMRSLRLLSILIFVILCGPVLLYCWWTNRPAPTEDPQTIT